MDIELRIAELESELAIMMEDPDYNKVEAGRIKGRISLLKKYGVDNPSKIQGIKEKKADTMVEKYGRKNGRGFGSSYTTNTMIKKYGAKGTLASSELRTKVKKTLSERYRVDNPSKSAFVRKKIKDTVLRRYGVTNPSKSPIIKRKKAETRRKHT